MGQKYDFVISLNKYYRKNFVASKGRQQLRKANLILTLHWKVFLFSLVYALLLSVLLIYRPNKK